MEKVGNEYNMRINKEKAKVTVYDKEADSTVHIIMNVDATKDVKEFKYLGISVTKDGRTKREINCRIAQAKVAFKNKKHSFTTNNII